MFCALPTILTLLIIRPDEINYERARGAKEGDKAGKYVGAHTLLKDRPLVIFLICAVMFHFANAAIASAAFGILFFFMPETRDKKFLNPIL